MCYIGIVNMSGKNNKNDSDDDMAFSSDTALDESGFGVRRNFEKIAVQRDYETGKIKGWKEFFNMARLQNPLL